MSEPYDDVPEGFYHRLKGVSIALKNIEWALCELKHECSDYLLGRQLVDLHDQAASLAMDIPAALKEYEAPCDDTLFDWRQDRIPQLARFPHLDGGCP